MRTIYEKVIGFKRCRRPPKHRQEPTNNNPNTSCVVGWSTITSWNDCKHLCLLPRHSQLQLDSAIEEWTITTETTAIQQHPPQQHHPATATTTMAHYKPTQPEKTPAVSPHSPRNSVYPVNDCHVLKYGCECRSMHWRI